MNSQLARLSTGTASLATIALIFGAAFAGSTASEGANPVAEPLIEISSLPCPYPQPIGLIGHAWSVGNLAIGIDVQGNYAYVGVWWYPGVFQAFDVADPCDPTLLPGSVRYLSNEIGDLAVHGARAFLANDANGFAVYDISDPNNPLLLSLRRDATFAHSVFYEGGDYAYVGYGWAMNKELAIYDVSTLPLAAPVIYPTGTGGLHDVFVAGARAYVFSGQQLDIVDVTNPLSPSPISTLALPHDQYGVEGEVRLQGDYVYLAMGDAAHIGGLRVVDVSNEYTPTVVATFDLPGGAGKMYAKGIGLAIAGDRAYVAARGGLWVFDISTPTTLTLMNNFALPADFGDSMGAHVEVRANLAYVTAYGSAGGLAIYKVHELPYAVAIDVKPGDDPNSINLCSKGAVPVAIFGSDEFDVDFIDTDTLRFAGATVKVVGKRAPHALCSKELVNEDSEYDLLCHFVISEISGVDGESTTATLNGLLVDGVQIEGSDAVNIVKDTCR